MLALGTRRVSLCLLCQFASRTTAARPQRHLPSHAQSAHHPTIAATRSFGRSSFNPLKGASPFNQAIQSALGKVKQSLGDSELLESLQLTPERFEEEWTTFNRFVDLWVRRDAPELRNVNSTQGARNLQARLKYLFCAQLYRGRFTQAEIENQKEVADLRYPVEWYPATRAIPRTIHMHVGPTNSGKTYHALKRLEEAERGIYLGPLRLLAHEVYSRLNAKGKPCALVTGEEQRMPDGDPKMWSCTVEMAPLNSKLDVAVIDEIQMINHKERGWAWTQAFLGIQAKEVHLCGEARTVDLIRELCALTGDKVHVHHYERLTPLKVARKSLNGKLDMLEKGDCVVSFSVLGIHSLRHQIENKTNRKCAIVYGSLPPETRAQQARLFNDPDNEYDFLVASDAVGMGLNLSIKRVVFETTMKNNGVSYVPLETSEVKQIAGRAGRYKTAHQAIAQGQDMNANSVAMGPAIGLDDPIIAKESTPSRSGAETVGYVTTLENLDMPYLKIGMEREPEPIRTAGIFPPSLVVERFANYFPPGTPFSYIMLRLHEISDIHPRFHLCTLKDQISVADAIHSIKNLSIQERIVICAAPTNVKDEGERVFLQALASCIADNESGNLLDLPIPLEHLEDRPSGERAYLYRLEQLHKMLVLYLWLSYRFPNVFTTRGLANYTKKLVEDAIELTLSHFSYTERAHRAMAKARREAVKMMKEDEKISGKQSPEPSSLSREGEWGNAPPELMNILRESRSFAAEQPPRDDEGEYLSPELESASIEEMPVTARGR